MQKSKQYRSTFFAPDIIRDAFQCLRQLTDPNEDAKQLLILECSTDEHTKWKHDSLDEFFADYRQKPKTADFAALLLVPENLRVQAKLRVMFNDHRKRTSDVIVEAKDRATIERVFEIFETNLEASSLPSVLPTIRPKVFIGHGRSPLWRELKDQLQDLHGFEIEAYEMGARAGHVIRDILEQMLSNSRFALLVMTGEDETADNQLNPRLNVVHELGLFQARLGFNRAIALLEEGTQKFSNIDGVHQIRFPKGNIRDTFGEVVATLDREFPRVT